MLRFAMFVVDLFLLLPWWGAAAVLIFMAIGLWALGHYLMYRFRREIAGAIKEQGKPLAEAHVTVHSIELTEPPTGASPLDDDDEDDFGDEELDGEFATDDFDYFWINATIAPQAAEACWDPSALALVPASFQPETEFEFCADAALLHTVEVWRNGQFQPQRAGNVTGTQRLRMLFAIPRDVHEAQFTYHFTTFGRFTLPARLETARCN